VNVVRLKPPAAREEAAAEQAVNDFQSETAEIQGRPDPLSTRLTLLIAGAMVVSVITWASFAMLDRVVSARGKMASLDPSIVVQPLELAIIKSLDARPGDVVHAGTVLATLDATFAQADVTQLERRLDALNALTARLEAEYVDRPFQPALAPLGSDVATQLELWGNRQAQLQAQLSSYDERIARARSAISSRQREYTQMLASLSIVREIEGVRGELYELKVGSRLNKLIATNSRVEAERTLANLKASEEEARHELDDQRAQREAFLQNWRSTTALDLVRARSERDVLIEQLTKAQKKRDLVTLTSPVDAVVLERANRSVNSVVQGAEALFTLVPLDAPLEAVVSIDAKEIGFVRPGDPVAVKFDAYNYQQHGFAEGVVLSISEDSIAANRDGSLGKPDQGTALFYRARIKITKQELRNVPADFRVMPGLPLTAEISVGERSVMGYLLRPLLRGLSDSMREP
jgi:type I secretion membrane fusion protein, HlyD family